MKEAKNQIDHVVHQNWWILQNTSFFQQHIGPMLKSIFDTSTLWDKILSFDILKRFRDLIADEYIDSYKY
jgi:hypothetical protein